MYPPVCVHCERVGDFFCEICWEEEVELANETHHIPQVDHIEAITALATHQGAIRSAIHALKYEHVPEVAQPLGEALAAKIPWTIDGIIPIPLHFTRLAERGYNQANLLAEAMAAHMNCPVFAQSLIRTKATVSQVTLNAEERHQNMQGVFTVAGSVVPRILLIDDVCTTGSTLGSAALALKEAGAKTIYAATVSLAQ